MTPLGRRLIAALLGVGLLAGACGETTEPSAPATTFPPDFTAERCLVRLHGRSGRGAAPQHHDGWAELAPDANEPYEGGGRVWIYDTPDAYAAARSAVTEVIDAAGCSRVVLHGFSNGAAFTGKLVCQGEDFGGRLVGAVVDDPVPDDASPDCSPAAGVGVAVYWTGGLTEATPGASCEDLGWTCAGGDELLSIEAYAARLGAEVQESVHTRHEAYDDAPELAAWLLP